ncbi:MAG: hypothetical protein JO255_10820, partial [Alphaproteobacteria bacterium]|nr:hypothetical protein [Alphaproteobacteria bacterium]
ELGRLRQAMLLGLARQPLNAPEALTRLIAASRPPRDPALTALALAGQQQRFQRAAFDLTTEGTSEAARQLHQDPRPILPGRARVLLLRLASGLEKGIADAALSIAIRRIVQAGFRPHPFDLPRLLPHIKADPRCLGLAERAFLALLDDPEGADAPSVAHAEITPETWTLFPRGHRVAFLRDERRKHPAKAREMLAVVFKSEPAAMRGDLLAALDVGIGSDDLPLLESLATDRAESVRTIVANLVARVAGTPAFAARLQAAAACFIRQGSGVAGMLRRIGLASSVAFKPPPSAKPAERHAALRQLFDGFSATEIGAAIGLTADDVLGALPADEEAVYDAFSARAARDGDAEMMMRLTEARLAVAEGKRRSPAAALAWLAGNLTAPVSVDFAKRLLAGDALQATLRHLHEATTPAAMKDDGTLVFTAALLPEALLAPFLEMIAPLPPAIGRPARDFAELTLALSRSSLERNLTDDDRD